MSRWRQGASVRVGFDVADIGPLHKSLPRLPRRLVGGSLRRRPDDDLTRRAAAPSPSAPVPIVSPMNSPRRIVPIPEE